MKRQMSEDRKRQPELDREGKEWLKAQERIKGRAAFRKRKQSE